MPTKCRDRGAAKDEGSRVAIRFSSLLLLLSVRGASHRTVAATNQQPTNDVDDDDDDDGDDGDYYYYYYRHRSILRNIAPHDEGVIVILVVSIGGVQPLWLSNWPKRWPFRLVPLFTCTYFLR